MSDKGAIKKVSSKIDKSQSRSRQRLKNVSSENNVEDDKNNEDRRKKFETKKPDNRLSKSTSNKSLSHKITDKQTVSSKKSTASINEISKTSRKSTNDVPVNSKTRSNSIKQEEKKFKENKPTGLSEKRGTSHIYIPKSNISKINTQRAEKSTRSIDNTTKKRKGSRTLSPSEIKILHSPKKPVNSSKSSIGKSSDQLSNLNDTSADVEYEDDFEDYESDFEECSNSDGSDSLDVSENSDDSSNSPQLDPIELETEKRKEVINSATNCSESHKVEEERMLDSGHYELNEARKRAAKIELMMINRPKTPSLTELRLPINREDKPVENKSLPLSTDEGFEDSRSGDFTKLVSPLSSQISIDLKKPTKLKPTKRAAKYAKRGKDLMGMIKLDTMGWSIFECKPVPYEEFIQSYGRLNTQQISTQTREDDIDVDIQTEEIVSTDKWTQFPITCRNILKTKEDVDLFKKEQIGVGGGNDNSDTTYNVSYDLSRLQRFLDRTGTVVLSLLEEEKLGGNVFQKNDKCDLPISNEFIKLSLDSVTFLSGRPVTIIHYSEILNKILLTVHPSNDKDVETCNEQDYITDCCIGCTWNILEPSTPKKLFYAHCCITACCFHTIDYNVVFAGLEDGSISLWDLREDEIWHKKVVDKANESSWILRTPTYTTGTDNEKLQDCSKIVTIRVLTGIETKSIEENHNKFLSIQICSLDESGCFIVWSILHNMGLNRVNDLGLSHWGNVRLVKSKEIHLKLAKTDNTNCIDKFVDMHVDSVDTNNLYIATNTQTVLHVSSIHNKIYPSKYNDSEFGYYSGASCIETCPFRESYFLVGCQDGTIRLHSSNVTKPLVKLKTDKCQGQIKSLQWSKSKPFIIYSLEYNDKSRIHVWDLNRSDKVPILSYEDETERISSFQLSPCRSEKDMANQYLALGTDTGNVKIHKLKQDFCNFSRKEMSEEQNKFKQYVVIL